MSESVIVDAAGNPLRVNGYAAPKPRPQLIDSWLASKNAEPRRTRATYDAARDSTEYAKHWANADGLDPDAANSRDVRKKLRDRSRYERQSNGIYAGIIETHVNMLVGVGPTLRMLTRNRDFNQLVEREFLIWSQQVQLRRKLWCLAHARTQDGESFAILQNNRSFPGVQLDVHLIEAEQCTTPFPPFMPVGYIDGIRFDPKTNEILWYDVLPVHPGANQQFTNMDPIRVGPREMLHWFKLLRPGTHRGIPAMTSTLNLGASARRMREATLAALETAADFSVILNTQLTPDIISDPAAPFSTMEVQHRQMTALPMGWEASQLRGEHPNATYESFNRSLISEQACPLNMPYNVASKDSSTYSFASGKLDTLCYRAAIDVERQDCNDLVLDPIFAQWFREWTTVVSRRDIPPTHQWDWPVHPVIDAVAEAHAIDTKLKNNTITIRQVFSDMGQDLEDQLIIGAEDTFGVADDASIEKMRQITTLKNTPAHAIQYVAQVLGVELPVAPQQPAGESSTPQPEKTVGLAAVYESRDEYRALLAALVAGATREPTQSEINVNVPTPVVNVEVAPAQVTVEAVQIHVEKPDTPIVNIEVAAAQIQIPEQQTPVVNVTTPAINLPEMAPVFNVAAPNVTVEAAATPVINVAPPKVDIHLPPAEEYDIVPERDPKTKLVKQYKRVKRKEKPNG